MLKKWFVKTGSILFPNKVVAFAYQQLTSPQVRKLRPHELLVLDQSQKETFEFQDFDIQLYTWKGGPKSVLLIHGWEGQAGNFADLVQELTVPNRFLERIDDVAQQVGITEKVKNKLITRLESEIGLDVAGLNVSDFVEHVQVKRALIIHDTNDRVIPIERAKKVNEHWKNADFLEIEGTGHFRILRTKKVLDQAIAFLNA